MDETTFLVYAEDTLVRLEAAVENAAELSGLDVDIETMPGGVLQFSFENGSKIIVNRHAAAGEIWIAGRSGGFHFRPVGDEWIAPRDGQELWAVLEGLVSQQGGKAVVLLR